MERWPELPYTAWKDTCATLQLWTQIVGKTRLALTPWLNHSWHVTLYVTARGLTTSLISGKDFDFEIAFDFLDHAVLIRAADGRSQSLALRPMTVGDFYKSYLDALAGLGIAVEISGTPNEVIEAIPFAEDRSHGSYDPVYANRFWRVLLRSHAVFSDFRSSFLGKASPVHFFWGSFDLAVTRFSGRRAPLHSGGFPHIPDAVVREAYSHEVSSAGFWPGGGGVDFPAYYSYAYPVPEGFSEATIGPPEACFSKELGEFLLPYDAVRSADDPERKLLEFLQSTYAAAAELGNWNRAALECEPGVPRRPRPVE
ncbi:MAG TPA: DUF5996 family protein [Rhizomicrobium sp.]|nr:DUF5996 family protein [Rhizomicrobium sp.]